MSVCAERRAALTSCNQQSTQKFLFNISVTCLIRVTLNSLRLLRDFDHFSCFGFRKPHYIFLQHKKISKSPIKLYSQSVLTQQSQNVSEMLSTQSYLSSWWVLLYIFFEAVPFYSHSFLPVAILLNKWNCCVKSGLTFGLTGRAATYFIALENVQNSSIIVHSVSGGFFLHAHLEQDSIEQGAYTHKRT